MKRLLMLTLTLVMLIALASCGGESSGNGGGEKWPANEITKGLPVPKGEIVEVTYTELINRYKVIIKWTEDEANAYIAELEKSGLANSSAENNFNDYIFLNEATPFEDLSSISIEKADDGNYEINMMGSLK